MPRSECEECGDFLRDKDAQTVFMDGRLRKVCKGCAKEHTDVVEDLLDLYDSYQE